MASVATHKLVGGPIRKDLAIPEADKARLFSPLLAISKRVAFKKLPKFLESVTNHIVRQAYHALVVLVAIEFRFRLRKVSDGNPEDQFGEFCPAVALYAAGLGYLSHWLLEDLYFSVTTRSWRTEGK